MLARLARALPPKVSCFGRLISSEAIVHDTFGDPVDVTRITTRELVPLKENDILVDMLRAPVNPADINKIQGTYPEKSILPAVGGNEGVAMVREVGAAVKDLCPGDHVIPTLAGIGTWQTCGVFQADDWIKIAKDVPLNLAATLLVNPCTAYRMLRDFVQLKEGDTIIQNGANSGVGQAVIQLAAMRNISTINIVRDRPNLSSLRDYLIGELGGTEVVTEEQLFSREMQSIVKRHGRPKLAFNGVGGKNTTEMLRHLTTGGTMVTYGGMARKPITIPVSAFIFKDFRAVGYWNSQWLKDNLRSMEHESMLKELSEFAVEGHLRAPMCTEVSLKDYKEVLSLAMKPYVSSKYIFVFHK